ncbi:MAG: methyltransferase domain-containing protein [Arcobacteraceae bacterium]|nr:methyltransferase domain-containing protein [Arcobacteraceae bacterium]
MQIQYSFTIESMQEILAILKRELSNANTNEVIFEVLNPDICEHCYAGKKLDIDNKKFIYRSYKAWVDLSEILYCKITTPTIHKPHTVILQFKKLDTTSSFHTKSTLVENVNKDEKYGLDSEFSQICKNEEPAFLEYYIRALKNVNVSKRKRILNLGINSGDEFEVIRDLCDNFQEIEFVGIDISKSAIEEAKRRFDSANFTFYTHDINKLQELSLGDFDLIITIGTLQSSGVEFKLLFNSIVQNYLKKDGAMILGFPNCRWIDGEMIYGAKAPNYNFSEMTLLFKDVYYCKKYLQQKKFRVSISGKTYPFLSATSIR